MKVSIKVPAMGESVLEAVVSKIVQPSGSIVGENAEILELETDKVNQTLYAPKSGKLLLTVKVGDKVKIGQELGSIDTDVAAEVVAVPPPVKLDIKKVETTGARKRAADFLAAPPAVKEAAPSVATPGRFKMSRLRQTVAARLVEIKNKTAMLTTFNEVDMGRVIEARAKEKEKGLKIGFMPFFIHAAALALKEFPNIHSKIEGDEIVLFPNYDIGVAVATEKGLMVPVIRGCDALSFHQIEEKLESLADKARTGKITIDDLRGGSFTITNGGVFGSLLSTPIINPGESAILGMHTIVKRPVALNDQVVIRPMMYLALSYDHRLIDGKEAVQFLVHIKKTLEGQV